jgi:hypothetical protein
MGHHPDLAVGTKDARAVLVATPQGPAAARERLIHGGPDAFAVIRMIETDMGRQRALEAAHAMAEQIAAFGHWRIDAATRTIAWSDGRGLARAPGFVELKMRLGDERQFLQDAHSVGRDIVPRHPIHQAQRHTIRQPRGHALVVPDLTRDERFVHSPLVVGAPHARFYAFAVDDGLREPVAGAETDAIRVDERDRQAMSASRPVPHSDRGAAAPVQNAPREDGLESRLDAPWLPRKRRPRPAPEAGWESEASQLEVKGDWMLRDNS